MARYQILRKLATGGMAEVFLGRAIGAGGFQKPVAIKRILPNLAADQEFVSRFHDEARLTVQLQHANVVQVFDLGKSNADHIMVLEFVDGDTLRAMLRDATLRKVVLPYHQTAFIIQQVAEGLAYAHEMSGPDGKNLNIVHRDINPSNVMVSTAGEVKLADFGIARAAMATSQTAAGVVRGKIGYFAPEVAKGADPDQRSDVYLMGLMLYEALGGKRLFKEQDFVKSLIEVAQFDVARVQPPPGVPDQLWEICLLSLHHDPGKRMPSARRLSLTLASFLFDNRLRVGPNDIAQLFAKAFPERKSSLHDIDAQPVAEVNLDVDATPGPMPAAPLATRTGALPRMSPPSRANTTGDFDLPERHTPTNATPHPSRPGAPGTRPRLGELLIQRKIINPQQLEQALAMQRRVGGRLGDVIVSAGMANEEDIYAVLAEQKGERFVRASKLEKFELTDALRSAVPRELASRLRVLPLSIDEKRNLYVAMVEPNDLKVLDEIRALAQVPRVFGVMIRPKTLDRMLDQLYLAGGGIELPQWVGEQNDMLERFGAKSGDAKTKEREHVFGEAELGGRPAAAPPAPARPSAPETRAAPAAPATQSAGAIDVFLIGASAVGDPLAAQLWRLTRLVRWLAQRLDIAVAKHGLIEREAAALFLAGHIERRRAYEAPSAAMLDELLPGAASSLQPLLQHSGAPPKLETLEHKLLAGVFALGERVGDLDAPPATRAAALLEMQRFGRVPMEVITALAEDAAQATLTIAVIASPGSALFSLVPKLWRAGHRVVSSTRDCFERHTVQIAIIDAELTNPSAHDVVQKALHAKVRVAAVAPPPLMPLIAPWKTLGDVTVVSLDRIDHLVGWVRPATKSRIGDV